jgi:hypothetical protein
MEAMPPPLGNDQYHARGQLDAFPTVFRQDRECRRARQDVDQFVPGSVPLPRAFAGKSAGKDSPVSKSREFRECSVGGGFGFLSTITHERSRREFRLNVDSFDHRHPSWPELSMKSDATRFRLLRLLLVNLDARDFCPPSTNRHQDTPRS